MDTQERLVEATRALLWERGYVGTSPKAIQQRAGVGQGSMYHHFAGKHDLALAAIRRTAAELRAAAEAQLSARGTPVERVTAYLRREREVLKGCPIGRLTQDPDVMADPELRAPVDETFTWLRGRLAEVLGAESTAAAIVAVLQGGYVLARASGGTEPFDAAIAGVLDLLRPPEVYTEPITREVVLDQPLPAPKATHRVEVRRIRIAPGHAAGLHVHNGPVFGSVEAGSVVYQIEGQPASVLAPGDTFYEPEGARIARFDARDDGVTFLAYFLLEPNQNAELEFPPLSPADQGEVDPV